MYRFRKSARGGYDVAYKIFMVVMFILAILWGPVMGSLVNIDKAVQVAQSNLSSDAEIVSKSVWFVPWKGCDSTDVAVFYVKPYIGLDGKEVSNALICSGFPFKGMTVRFK